MSLESTAVAENRLRSAPGKRQLRKHSLGSVQVAEGSEEETGELRKETKMGVGELECKDKIRFYSFKQWEVIKVFTEWGGSVEQGI